MLEEDLKLKTRVGVSTICEYYADYGEEVLTIVGLNIDKLSGKVDVTLRDKNGLESDGWEARDIWETFGGEKDDKDTTH